MKTLSILTLLLSLITLPAFGQDKEPKGKQEEKEKLTQEEATPSDRALEELKKLEQDEKKEEKIKLDPFSPIEEVEKEQEKKEEKRDLTKRPTVQFLAWGYKKKNDTFFVVYNINEDKKKTYYSTDKHIDLSPFPYEVEIFKVSTKGINWKINKVKPEEEQEEEEK